MLRRTEGCISVQKNSNMYSDASAHGPQVMMDFLKEWEEKLHVKITCSQVRQGLVDGPWNFRTLICPGAA